MEISITEQRNNLSKKIVSEIEEMFIKNGYEIFRTGDNLSTITIPCGEIAGKELYGSWKFTLHKADYDLDDEIEAFEDKLARDEKKTKERAKTRAQKEQESKARQEALQKAKK